MKYLYSRNRRVPRMAVFFLSSFLPVFCAPKPIVVGFVGGFVHRNNSGHSEVQLAARLRKDYAPGVQLEDVPKIIRAEARRDEILRLLDSNHDGTLSSQEKADARIAIYGHSWGASETVTLARALGEQGVPVALTIQVDSVRKPGENDAVIPANVAEAANFYQQDGILKGLRKICAADATHRRILGNFRSDYKTHTINCAGYPWYARMFMRPHIEIESDPASWAALRFSSGRTFRRQPFCHPPLDRVAIRHQLPSSKLGDLK